MKSHESNRSIRKQLLTWLLLPLFTLSFLSGLISWPLSYGLATDIYDMELINSADSVVARLHQAGNGFDLDIPDDVLSVLKHDNKDDFYYQVWSADLRQMRGDRTIEPPPVVPAYGDPDFRDGVIDGHQVRIAVMKVNEPAVPKGYVLVQVAETRNTRKQLITHLLLWSSIPQLLLIAAALVISWFAVSRGLLPLHAVQQAVSSRSPWDLRPVAIKRVPLELVSLVEALNNLFFRLSEDIESQRRFAANAAHQLRTPLAGLKTYVDIARRTSNDEKVSQLLEQVNVGLGRMTHLVQRLLTLARTEPAVMASQVRSTVDLNAIASDASTDLVGEAIKKNIELEFEGWKQAATICGDLSSLQDLVINVVENAILYTQPGGRVRVSVTVPADGVLLCVEDNGPGIPEDLRDRVFERFFRVLGTEVEGSGLGLSIVREIALAHQAQAWIENSTPQGNGTRVCIKFPNGERSEPHVAQNLK